MKKCECGKKYDSIRKICNDCYNKVRRLDTAELNACEDVQHLNEYYKAEWCYTVLRYTKHDTIIYYSIKDRSNIFGVRVKKRLYIVIGDEVWRLTPSKYSFNKSSDEIDMDLIAQLLEAKLDRS